MRKNGIKLKMNLYILSAVVVVFILSFAYVLYSYSSTSVKMANELALSKASDVANRTELYLTNSLQIAKTTTNTILSLRKAKKSNTGMYSLILSNILKENDNILAIWVLWEPKVYRNNKDSMMYSGFYDTKGRLNITWFKNNGEIKPGIDQTYTDDSFYTIPKESGKEVLLDPYHYKYTSNSEEHFVTTVAYPIKENGQVIGVVGLDVDLQALRDINSQTKLYKTGYSAIISHDYSVVAHHDDAVIGKDLLSVLKLSKDGKIAQAVRNGNSLLYNFHSEYLKADVLSAFAPIQVGETDTPWSLEVIIAENEILSDANSAILGIIVIGIIALLIIGLVVYFIAKSILGPVLSSVSFAKKIAEGDLTENIKISGNDELSELLSSLNKMSGDLNKMVSSVKSEAIEIAQTSDSLKSMSAEFSRSSSEQAGSIEEVSSSMEEMVSNIEQNAQNSKETGNVSNQISSIIGAVGESSDNSLKYVEAIANKISIVHEIAFQTNLLALNASVEAARAGEHGKGFAVVASEVRKLAENSSKSAAEISKLSEDTLKTTQLASKMVNELIPEIEKISKLIQEIEVSSSEQNSGANQINDVIVQLNDITQNNASSSEELAANADELTKKSIKLTELVQLFKTK